MTASVLKYGNKRIQTEDGWFDSLAEHRRWGELKLLEKAGAIRSLRRQVDFELIPRVGSLRPIIYRADFVYEEAPEWKEIVEDRKGFKDRVYRLKCRMMLWRHGIVIRET